MAKSRILSQKEYKRMERKEQAIWRAKIVLQLVAVFALIALALVLLGFIISLCWGFVMPSAFGLPAINFWQGICLFVLSALIIAGPIVLAKIIMDALSF